MQFRKPEVQKLCFIPPTIISIEVNFWLEKILRRGEAGIFSEANPEFRGLVNHCLRLSKLPSAKVLLNLEFDT